MHRRHHYQPAPPPNPYGKWAALVGVTIVVLIVALLAHINRDAVPPPPADAASGASAPAAATVAAPLPPPPAGLPSGDITDELRDELFQILPESYADKTVYVHKEAYADLISMMDTARRDGVHLQVVSGFRSYKHQKAIWERKWAQFSGSPREKSLAVLAYSSFPGASRHHWGTDVDFNSVEPDHWLSENGMKTELWLRKHAAAFGFCQPYAGNRARGHANEAWHWSHRSAKTVAHAADSTFLTGLLKRPVSGAEVLTVEDLQPYVQDIAAECR